MYSFLGSFCRLFNAFQAANYFFHHKCCQDFTHHHLDLSGPIQSLPHKSNGLDPFPKACRKLRMKNAFHNATHLFTSPLALLVLHRCCKRFSQHGRVVDGIFDSGLVNVFGPGVKTHRQLLVANLGEHFLHELLHPPDVLYDFAPTIEAPEDRAL